MVSFKKLAAASVIPALAAAGDAPVVSDSPDDAKYIAVFHGNNTNNVQGNIEFVGASNGSTWISIHVEGLPTSGGPFPYHIHEKPVPADGDCYATLGHLNPYNGSMDATNPAGKEVGDLAGKHGAITGTGLNATYIDNYVSLDPNDPAFAGNLSIVIHYADNTRLACANIVKEKSANVTTSTGKNGTSSSSSSESSSTSGGKGGHGSNSTESTSKGAAVSNAANGILIGALAAGISLLI